MKPSFSRRGFVQGAGAVALGFLGLKRLLVEKAYSQSSPAGLIFPYGELVPDPNKIIDLPARFSYTVLSRTGDRMNDGYAVPGAHDGMATYPGPDGKTILVRNHEMGAGTTTGGPFAGADNLFTRTDRSLIYDAGQGTRPSLGGTTTLLFDTRTQTLESHFLSLTGTVRNCAGGVMPWGTWITCEETNQRAVDTYEQDHGWNFEVPATTQMAITRPVPIKAMGRFSHEAVAIDERSGIVYQTEDRGDSLFYRYIPNERGNLLAGGRLQALAVRDRQALDTRNYTASSLPVGDVLAVTWVDIEDVESPQDDLRTQGWSKGAARFARGEGAWASREAIYFACTDGGTARKGQIFRYVPSAFEGRAEEGKYPGFLELFLEPNEGGLVENCDNVAVTPWGDLMLCEDGPNEQFLVGVNLRGEIYKFGRNALNTSEFAGATFSPDGTTLFVNIQSPGLTIAIVGPWQG